MAQHADAAKRTGRLPGMSLPRRAERLAIMRSSFAVFILLLLIVAAGIFVYLGRDSRREIAQPGGMPPPLWTPRQAAP